MFAPFEGRIYLSQGLEPLRGSSLLGKGQGHLMPAVAAVVSRRGRAFSGAAATRVVGGVGWRTWPPATALRLPRRDDGVCAVAWPPRSWWAPFVSERIFSPGVNARGAYALESTPAAYKSDGRGRGGFYLCA
jgi:hypothetical protein